MTKSNGEEPRAGGRMRRFQQGVRKRTLLAKKKVQSITKEDVKSYLFRNAFVLLTVTAVVVGTILGFTLRPYKMTYREVKYFSFPGELLMRMLQMLVLPLIISSLVTGMAALDRKASGKMGMRAVVYYMTTTIIAVVIGIIMVIIIHPGKGTKENMHREGKVIQVTAADAFLDLIRNMFPPNLVEACFKQFKTNYEKRSIKVPAASNETLLGAVINNVSDAMETLSKITEEMIPVPGSVNGVNALGLVVFSMCFGFVIGNMKEQGQALKDFFDSLNEAIMRLVAVIMWYVFPLAVYAMSRCVLPSAWVLTEEDAIRQGGHCNDLILISTRKAMTVFFCFFSGKEDRSINDERESLIGCLLHTSHWVASPQPGHGPRPGVIP
uniref:Amino acid transporter n=1 Tax=Pipistrellus kuhlii TaxID=59472 RepID=A0A7J7YZ34_PIPKU|nr:solute carrier family 1 member 3 [Pipistrellus kuhlii]